MTQYIRKSIRLQPDVDGIQCGGGCGGNDGRLPPAAARLRPLPWRPGELAGDWCTPGS